VCTIKNHKKRKRHPFDGKELKPCPFFAKNHLPAFEKALFHMEHRKMQKNELFYMCTMKFHAFAGHYFSTHIGLKLEKQQKSFLTMQTCAKHAFTGQK
jgi:hypothetical protein